MDSVEPVRKFSVILIPPVLNGLKKELPAYIAKAADLSETIDPLAWMVH